MINLVKILLIGWVFVFGVAACSSREGQEQVSGEREALESQNSFMDATKIPTNQIPLDNRPEFQEHRDYDELEIVTLLPRDGIPAIDNPEFLSAEQADEEYALGELVIGVNYDGDARAYSIPYLSNHEIVNDTVGGRKIAVTW
jgi:hypothetical protein